MGSKQAVQDLRSTDLSMWASRYNLFVLWSADRQHPWDSLPGAERIAATLEIGKAEQEEKVSCPKTPATFLQCRCNIVVCMWAHSS